MQSEKVLLRVRSEAGDWSTVYVETPKEVGGLLQRRTQVLLQESSNFVPL